MAIKTLVAERRRFPRGPLPPRAAINLLQPHTSVSVASVNYGEGGVCLRLEEAIEVRSLVRLQLTPERPGPVGGQPRPVECTGRVAWVIQRLDLRPMPPFLFDVGIEFVDPPPVLRQLIAQRGGLAALKKPSGKDKALEFAAIRGRHFIPHVEREGGHSSRWHLVVSVDGVPCFSGRYPSERAALAAWAKFKRQQGKR